jgi:spore coat polysaccharide biosynthesis predicted glycosyltransferase SpsG
MNRFTHTLIKVAAIATLAAGSYTLPALALAAAPSSAVTITSADIQAKADQYAKIAADYRVRMRFDEKYAIQFFTLANYWDQKAERYRRAGFVSAGTPPDSDLIDPVK